MKYMKRAGIYQASNCTFNPKSIEARSYSWWVFVAVIEGKVVFNNYSYSNTTRKHQWKVRSLMHELGITIDLMVETKSSLSSAAGSLAALEDLVIETLNEAEFHQAELRNRRNERARIRRAEKKAQSIALVTHAAHESQAVQARTLTLVKGA